MERYMSVVGILVIYGIAYAISTNRSRINWRTVSVGFAIQFALGLLLLKMEATAALFQKVTLQVAYFLSLSQAGASMVFGDLANMEKNGFIFAVQVAPTIIFFSAFISVLYYFGVIQVVIKGIAFVMRTLMGTSGSETLSCSANIFVGQTEAPLLIRPYLANMTNSELMAVMTGGFATIAGGVLAAYIGMGIPAGHLIVASVMGAPAALVLAKLIVPETEHSETAGDAEMPKIDVGSNALDAASRGTSDGLMLALNVMAMLIAFTALVAVADWILGGADWLIDYKLLGGELSPDGKAYIGWFPASLKTIFGTLFAPLAFLMGVPWVDAAQVGNLLGLKICVNEFVGYAELSVLMSKGLIGERAVTIATYALCGFANFASIGIQIGGIGALAPERRSDLAKVGLRAMIAGSLASFTTACIAGILI